MICAQGTQGKLGSSEDSNPEQCMGIGNPKSRRTQGPRDSLYGPGPEQDPHGPTVKEQDGKDLEVGHLSSGLRQEGE